MTLSDEMLDAAVHRATLLLEAMSETDADPRLSVGVMLLLGWFTLPEGGVNTTVEELCSRGYALVRAHMPVHFGDGCAP